MAWYVRDKRLSEFAVEKTLKVFENNGLRARKEEGKGYDIVLADGKKVEVKFDTWIRTTGNISAEWFSNEDTGSPGWVQYSDADIMIYMYDFDNAFAIDMKKLKEYIQNNLKVLLKTAKYAYRKKGKALNLMVHLPQVPQIRLTKYEKMFSEYALLESSNF